MEAILQCACLFVLIDCITSGEHPSEEPCSDLGDSLVKLLNIDLLGLTDEGIEAEACIQVVHFVEESFQFVLCHLFVQDHQTCISRRHQAVHTEAIVEAIDRL